MQVGEILAALDLGNSVAEYDEALQKYFVETPTFRALIRDEGDIIAGDKGTGKTALFRILQQRYPDLEELAQVEVVAGFNPVGSPVFQRLAEGDVLEEGQYVTIWKAYALALTGNWILSLYDGQYTDSMFKLDEMLKRMDLRSADDSPSTVFSQVVNLVRRLANPTAAEVAVTISPDGFPIFVPRVEMEGEAQNSDEPEWRQIPHDEALGLLNTVLDEVDLFIWLVLDRLDEAFAGFPAAEIPALRALLRTYLDLREFPRLRLKLFVRKDLFGRIIQGGFVNLTHVNAKKIEIVWDEEDLKDLLVRRIRENPDFVNHLGVSAASVDGVFDAVFPQKVDKGSRKPTSWVWMIGRIRDANYVRPPRNLIDLVKKAQEEQRRREARTPTEWSQGMPVIASEALKRGLARLSAERVEDTLLAEAGDYAVWIDKFRGGKAEHNEETLKSLLGVEAKEASDITRVLADLGFLEKVGENYKIPMLYRDGLSIRGGKAFTRSGDNAEEEEDEE